MVVNRISGNITNVLWFSCGKRYQHARKYYYDDVAVTAAVESMVERTHKYSYTHLNVQIIRAALCIYTPVNEATIGLNFYSISGNKMQ